MTVVTNQEKKSVTNAVEVASVIGLSSIPLASFSGPAKGCRPTNQFLTFSSLACDIFNQAPRDLQAALIQSLEKISVTLKNHGSTAYVLSQMFYTSAITSEGTLLTTGIFLKNLIASCLGSDAFEDETKETKDNLYLVATALIPRLKDGSVDLSKRFKVENVFDFLSIKEMAAGCWANFEKELSRRNLTKGTRLESLAITINMPESSAREIYLLSQEITDLFFEKGVLVNAFPHNCDESKSNKIFTDILVSVREFVDGHVPVPNTGVPYKEMLQELVEVVKHFVDDSRNLVGDGIEIELENSHPLSYELLTQLFSDATREVKTSYPGYSVTLAPSEQYACMYITPQ